MSTMLVRISICILAVLVLGGLAHTPVAHAAGIVVNTIQDDQWQSNGSCTLREAINNVNAGGDTSGGDCTAATGNDTITFSVSGTSTILSVLPTIRKPVTIQGPGPTLDGGGSVTLLRVNAPSGPVTVSALNFSNASCDTNRNGGGAITNLTNFTIFGGVFTNNDAGDCNQGGGAIENQGGTLTINNTQFVGNTATSGAAIYNSGTLKISNNAKFKNNTAYNGAAIYNASENASVTINQTSFTGNEGYSYAGAIYNSKGKVKINNSTFTGNTTGDSGYGGAIYNDEGVVNVINTTIANGWAKRAGAIYTNIGNLNITASALINNRGWGSGGAIYDTSSNIVITNSTLTQNSTAGEYGGTIYTEYGLQLYLVNSTMAGNTCVCPEGYGAAGILAVDSNVTLRNSILANWWGDGNNYDCSGDTFTADAYNLTYDTACDRARTITPYDLLLGDLGDNGGPTQTMRPYASSDAINAGNDAVCAAAVGGSSYGAGGVDQRGVNRPQGAHCDIGAVETKHQ